MNISKLLKSMLFVMLMFLPYAAFGQETARKYVTVEVSFTNKPIRDKCDGSKGFCLIIHVDLRTSAPKGKGVRSEVSIEGGKLRVDFKTPLPGKGNPKKRTEPITIFEDLTLDVLIARDLGYKSIIIKKGDYPVDYSRQKFGSALFEAALER